MNYSIFSASGVRIAGGEGVYNVGWKSGDLTETVAIFVGGDDNRIEVHPLGNGFSVTVDFEPPAHAEAVEKAKELDRAVNPEADQILRPGH
jgi:hypothetical protein